jgi:hypothetical protein
MKIYTNEYTQKVYEIIEPLVGDLMARGTIKTQINSIGSSEVTLHPKDLPLLADKIKKGLVIFIGSDSASIVASRIAQIQ